jgi:hypothetical protein
MSEPISTQMQKAHAQYMLQEGQRRQREAALSAAGTCASARATATSPATTVNALTKTAHGSRLSRVGPVSHITCGLRLVSTATAQRYLE